MKQASGGNTSAEIRRFLSSVPSADAIRDRLAQRKSEVAFLRRLLKLAVDAERAGKVRPCLIQTPERLRTGRPRRPGACGVSRATWYDGFSRGLAPRRS